MSRAGEAFRFASIGVAIALLSALPVLALGRAHGREILVWSLGGWALMAVVGIAAGVWMVRSHGRPGSGFLAALAGGMLSRLFLSAAGAAWAARQDIETVWAFLGGLAAGYVPLQTFELAWFIRRGRGSLRDLGRR